MALLPRNTFCLSILLFVVVCLVIFTAHSSNDTPGTLASLVASPNLSLSTKSKSKNAYCVFLAEPYEQIKDKEEDYYFMGTRMLLYQLLHDPETKTNENVPFVVLVTVNVPQWKRDQLTYEGAEVIEVSSIKIPWIKPGRPRWEHVMDKLHVFELVQFDKVLLFDTDMVVTQSLNGIFEDPATVTRDNLNDAANIADDEGPQPARYMMSGNGVSPVNHTYPAPRNGRLNAGFVLFQPSIEMYNYYMSVAQIEGRFPGGSPEQDLWNYAHRRKGNMPWTQLDQRWTINTPNMEDYRNGIATLHEKYWRCRDTQLREVLLRSRYKMQGFFQSYVPPHARRSQSGF